MSNFLRHYAKRALPFGGFLGVAAGVMLAASGTALAQSGGYGHKITNDAAKCRNGAGPAVLVTINGIKSSDGILRVQSYRGIQQEWLEKGKWLNRIEVPAKQGSMTICMPVPVAGTYGIAVRHDTNGNGKTELSKDGGAMSNNPSLNIFNLGRPSYKKTRFEVGQRVEKISINMRYR